MAVAEPVSGTLGAGPPGAESATFSVPVRVVGETELGLKVTKTRHEELAAMAKLGATLAAGQLVVAE